MVKLNSSQLVYFGAFIGVCVWCLGEIIHPSSRNLNFEIVSQPPVRQAIPMHMAPGISRTELYYHRPRGKRAGLKAKADESRRRFNIPVVLPSRPRYANSSDPLTARNRQEILPISGL